MLVLSYTVRNPHIILYCCLSFLSLSSVLSACHYQTWTSPSCQQCNTGTYIHQRSPPHSVTEHQAAAAQAKLRPDLCDPQITFPFNMLAMYWMESSSQTTHGHHLGEDSLFLFFYAHKLLCKVLFTTEDHTS